MVFLQGASAAPFGRDKDPAELVRQAASGALDDAGIRAEQVDALVVANAAAEGLAGFGSVATWTATQAGLVDRPALRVETGPSSGLAAVLTAWGLVASGRFDHVLVVGWESMTRVPTAQATEVLGRLMAADERALGLSLPALVAMLTSAYVARHDTSEAALARVSVQAHRLAVRNPVAQFRHEITVEDVLASRMIAEPVRLLHCAPLTDGAAAVVVSRDGPVAVRGLGAATAPLGYAQRDSRPERFEASTVAMARALADAGLSRGEVDVAEVHDAFSVLQPVALEDLGFAPPGGGLDLLFAEDDPLACRPACNPSGGLKARGHPVGATGLAQLAELFDQLTGRAPNQVDGARVGLAHNIGGFGNNVHVALLEGAR